MTRYGSLAHMSGDAEVEVNQRYSDNDEGAHVMPHHITSHHIMSSSS